MDRHWTFGRKIAAGFALVVAFTIAIGVVATVAMRNVVEAKDRVITVDSPFLLEATRMQGERRDLATYIRAFMLSGDAKDLAALQQNRAEFLRSVDFLKQDTKTEAGTQLIDAIEQTYAAHLQASDQIVALRQSGAPLAAVAKAYDDQIPPLRNNLDHAIQNYLDHRKDKLEQARQAATDTATSAINIILIVAVGATLMAGIVAFYLTGTLNRQIGAAVSHVQSSSAELQSAANQQATGAKEQVTSMSEITTTISELLATSRQIAESAQRVAQISEDTTSAARSGDGTVERANESISGIRRQVDLVVGHMLELGKKSQQIGSVLDIVSELAEQTNILSINATIEAAGAGESGKRFAVVADEIRKLADRVGRLGQGNPRADRRRAQRGQHHRDGDRNRLQGRRRRLAAVRRRGHRLQGDRRPGDDDHRGGARDRAVHQAAGHRRRAGQRRHRQRRAGDEGDRGDRRADACRPRRSSPPRRAICCGWCRRRAQPEWRWRAIPTDTSASRRASCSTSSARVCSNSNAAAAAARSCRGCCAWRIRSRAPPASSRSRRSPTGRTRSKDALSPFRELAGQSSRGSRSRRSCG